MTEPLMPQQRACMLRILREVRNDRKAELERLRILNRPTELLKQVELEEEIECIEKSVAWLWAQP